MKYYIYYEGHYGKVSFNSIAQSYYDMKKDFYQLLKKVYGTDEKIREYLNRTALDKKKLVEAIRREDIDRGYGNPFILEKAEFVQREVTERAEGEYYAHEYDVYAPAKRRTYRYTNGYIEYEINCLNKTLRVLDGYWLEPDNNGCGDRFEVTKILSKKGEKK